jgi:predicted transglutaminase-like cysteine proteinase
MRMSQATGNAASAPTVSDSVDTANALNCDQSLLPSQPTADVVPANAILGSMPVSVRQTPFDRDWSYVRSRNDMRGIHRAVAASGARRADNESAKIEAVNSWVNRTIAFGDDRAIYGRADYWAPASETLRRGTGDCEDFAIAKMELLSALGISHSNMRLVVARDLVRNADHAVLVVILADRSVMLDNVTDQLLDARLPNDYRPIMSFSRNAKWVHGYAVQPATPVRMASAATLPRPAANKMPDVLTVSGEPDFAPLSLALLSVPLVLPTELSARV